MDHIDNSLSGSIPSALGDLTNLEYLDLAGGDLHGSIPKELGHLESLDELRLHENFLSGPIPSEFANLDNLATFHIYSTSVCLPTGDSTLAAWYGSISDRDPSFLPDCIAPIAPSSLVADVQAAANVVVLYWDDPDDVSIERWQVRWKTDGEFGDWAEIPDSDEHTTSYAVTDVTVDVAHTFEVRAVNVEGAGSASSVTATPIGGDKGVLLTIYNATNGDNWADNTGWDFTQPLTSSWHGVTVTDGRVTELNLSGQGWWSSGSPKRGGMDGVLPDEIGDLEQLVSLDLGFNNLTGPIPTELGDLENLQYLDLSHIYHALPGHVIPSELGNLANLRVLNLSGNDLGGAIPSELGDLENLTYFSLAGTI